MRVCVVVATKTKARFLSLVRRDPGDTPRLVERLDLVNPELSEPQHERYGSERAEAQGRIATGGQYVLDDGRQEHDRILEERFAKTVMEETARVCKATSAERLILCAEPQMLGHLRSVDTSRELPNVTELGVNLINVPPAKIQEQLVRKGALRASPPKVQTLQWRARGA